ncbi:putative cytochrome P450 oxidoreductase [Acephala macrosclerotiorum]|nr:putative cytochrome P450 oxidoreductase [Acephala macrosclerotiorum]
MFELSLSSLSLLALGLCIAYSIVSVIMDPLRGIPGPFLARFTRLWYFFELYKGSFEISNVGLHKTYGPIVRIAPNEYSVDDMEAAKLIYKVGNGFVKAPWYWAWMPPAADRANLFSDLDPHHHASQRRKFASAYTMTSVVEYEPCVNECTALLAQRLGELAAYGHTTDFGHWLHCYAFDVISLITFSKRFGFLDNGQDKDKLFEAIDHHNAYSTLVGVFPSLHRFLFPLLLQTGGYGTLLSFAMKQIETHRKLLKDPTTTDHDGPQDFMVRFLNVHQATPNKMSMDDIFAISITNIAAGSDTTAAVIKEALRLHPATGLGLQRCVPAAGTLLCGRMFPGGTTVGINAWVAHRNTSVYGPDADKWRPERWLEIEADGRGAEVEQYFLAFGLGSRTCIGKNISFLELNKLVPRLLRQFDLVLDEELSKREWRTVNRFFVKPEDFRGRIVLRTTEKGVRQTA